MPLKNASRNNILKYFDEMEQNLAKILQNNESRLSFTLDAWTAPNNKSFYGMTVHFIDNNWSYHSLALDFKPSDGNHTGKYMAALFFETLKKFGIQNKVEGITLDNAHANSTFIEELGKLMDLEGIDFDTQDQHFRCFPHILNLAVKDILKLINIDSENSMYVDLTKLKLDDEDEDEDEDTEDSDLDSEEALENHEELGKFSELITKVRSVTKKIRKSQQLEKILQHCCALCCVEYNKLELDVVTRWNSTYNMLSSFLYLKPAILLMFDQKDVRVNVLKLFKLSEVEWSCLEKIVSYLANFKYVSDILSKEKIATLPSVVVACNTLIDEIENLCFELDNKPDRTEDDEVILLAFQAGRNKLLKHYKKCNWLYCVSLILDPRHKVETFDVTSWGKELKEQSLSKFYDLFKQKYFQETENDKTESTNQNDNLGPSGPNVYQAFKSIYKPKLISNESWKEKIDRYLKVDRETEDTNVIEWWKNNAKVYPNLARMARDILSILASAVPVERLFSQGSLVMTRTRTRLKDDILKPLICIKNWMSSYLKYEICRLEF